MATYQKFATGSVIEVEGGALIAAIKEHDRWAGEYKVLLSVGEAQFVIQELSKFVQKNSEREAAQHE